MKLLGGLLGFKLIIQPPSGGCVLKQVAGVPAPRATFPAAFRRLCVETFALYMRDTEVLPAAFRRLCVETYLFAGDINIKASRLQAAVC